MGEADDGHEHPPLRSEHCDRQQGEHKLRDGEDDIVESHDHGVEGSADIGGEHADDRADDHTERGGEHTVDDERHTAGEEPGEHIAAEVVRSEQTIGTERLRDELGGGVAGRPGQQQRTAQSERDDDHGDDQADLALFLREHPLVEGNVGGGGFLGHLCGIGGRGLEVIKTVGVGAHAALLSFGLVRMPTTSAARFTTT